MGDEYRPHLAAQLIDGMRELPLTVCSCATGYEFLFLSAFITSIGFSRFVYFY